MKHLLAATLFLSGWSLAGDHDAERIAAPSHHTSTIVLAAHPMMMHPAYRQTVVLVTSLGSDRYAGVIVNRPTTTTLSTIFPDDEPSRLAGDRVYFGGPMGMDTMLVITSGGDSPGGMSLRLGESLYLAFEQPVIDRVIKTKSNGARYFVGLVQWPPGELREELRQGFWNIIKTSPQRVLQTEPGRLWKELTKEAGVLVARSRATGCRDSQDPTVACARDVEVAHSRAAHPQRWMPRAKINVDRF